MLDETILALNEFLSGYLPLLNSHNVDYLTNDHWNTFVPECIRENYRDINLYNEQISTKNIELNQFLHRFTDFRKQIEGLTTDKSRFLHNQSVQSSTRIFTSQKKSHEIEILAPVIHQIAIVSNSQSVDFS